MEIDDKDFVWLMDIANRFLKWNPLNTGLENKFKYLKERYNKNGKNKMQKMWESFNKSQEY